MSIMKRIATHRIWDPAIGGDEPEDRAMRKVLRAHRLRAFDPGLADRLAGQMQLFDRFAEKEEDECPF